MSKKRRRKSQGRAPAQPKADKAPTVGEPPAPAISRKEAAERQERQRRVQRFSLALFVVALAAYAQTIAADFTYDDVHIVRDNPLIASLANLPEIFSTDYWGRTSEGRDTSLYRPFTIATYALNYAVHGLSPWGYHFVNILLHALGVLVLFRLIYELFDALHVAFIAALWFAVHPVHTEAVAGVVGRAELLAFLGITLCIWGYRRGLRSWDQDGARARGLLWLLASVAAYAMGAFSKEAGMLAPVFIVLYELTAGARRSFLRGRAPAVAVFLAYAGVLTGYLYIRSRVTTPTVVVFGLEDMPAGQRVCTALRVCVQYVGLLIFPRTLLADYSEGAKIFAYHITDPSVLIALVLLLAGLVFLVWSWKRLPAAWWGLLFFLVMLFPVSNIPFLIGVIKAERLLYAPSAGFLAAAAAVLVYRLDTYALRSTLWTIACVVAVLFLGRTWVRNLDWRNNYTLATATLRESPSSLTFNTIMATWYREHGRNDLARPYLERTRGRGPDKTASIYNLANIELDEGHYEEAIRLYREVLDANPSQVNALNNLGIALEKAGRAPEAVRVFGQLLERDPDSFGAYINLCHLHVAAGDLQRALAVIEAGVERFPQLDAMQWNAGMVYQALGRGEEAEAAVKRARAINPDIGTQENVKRRL